MNLVPNLFRYWFNISFCSWGEVLKRPMKRVQGMVQKDSPRNLKYSSLEFILRFKGIECIDSRDNSDYDIREC